MLFKSDPTPPGSQAATALAIAYALYFTITWLPFYLVHEHHMPMKDMVNTAALYYSVDAVSALATGCLSDFFIRRGFSPPWFASQPWLWDG